MPMSPRRKGQILREILVFLSGRENAPKEEIHAHVERAINPTGEELDLVSGDVPQWLSRLDWDSLVLVKAGWLEKDGWGVWRITKDGEEALRQFVDPEAFWIAAGEGYKRWAAFRPRRRAWLVRGSSVLGSNVVPDWLATGYCSLAASQLREIQPGVEQDELRIVVEEDYAHLRHRELRNMVEEVTNFVLRMREGDLVLTTSEAQAYVGDVAGDWTYQRSEDGRTNLRRAVEWRNPEAPVDFAQLPTPIPARLQTGGTVVELTNELGVIDELLPLQVVDVETALETETALPVFPVHKHLADPSMDLADKLFVDRAWLQEVRDILDERRQLVFYGPPGTGKTFIAQRLAEHLVGLEQVKLVQFHPAYTYEDFFEGYRPVPVASEGGTIAFDLRDGPLRRLVNRAREHPDLAYVLIIDEINRANLAKVFGELYFLLEYREQAVDLLYSADEEGFTLPTNLYLIGTMNTADRSIALVDAAMRRRFAFVALHPSEEPTQSLLRRWSEHHGLGTAAADLLERLNAEIADSDFLIGPAYFMKSTAPDAHSRLRLARIWATSILPLLQEQYYGEWDDVESRFLLDTLLPAGGQENRAPAGPMSAAEVAGTAEGDGGVV